MALTGQDILNAVNKAPVGQKVGVVAAVVVALSVANWYFFVDPMQTQITVRQGQLRGLLSSPLALTAKFGISSRSKEIENSSVIGSFSFGLGTAPESA